MSKGWSEEAIDRLIEDLQSLEDERERGEDMEVQEKLAAALLSSNASMLDKIDIGEDSYENVDLIIEFYSKPCKWEYDEVCVNDQSEWCADFIDNIKCGGCQEYEVKKD